MNGKPIYSPDELLTDRIASSPDVHIYICSGPWSSGEIFINLRDKGIPSARIRFIDESAAYGIPWQSYIEPDGSMHSIINGNDFAKIGGDYFSELIFDENLANSQNYHVGYE